MGDDADAGFNAGVASQMMRPLFFDFKITGRRPKKYLMVARCDGVA
jgi:hypothetical protein